MPCARSPAPTRRRRGFTVLEVLIAVTILGILSLVIFSLFRTAANAQKTADRDARIMQQARFAMDVISKDIANIYFRDETSYNVQVAKLIEEMEAARLQAEANNDWEQFFALYGNPDEPEEDQEPTIGDPFKKGRIIDLQMQGEKESVSFTVRSPLQVGGYYRPWGLARVEYTVRDKLLVRTAKTVETDRRNQLGERSGEPRVPEVAKLADGVESFELGYAFWFDNQWYEVDKWNSANRQIRNPRYFLGTYDDENIRVEASEGDRGEQLGGESFGPGSPGFNASLNDNRNEPLDRLPQLIRIRLKLTDPKDGGRTHSFESVFRVPLAQETWVPIPEITEDIREAEQLLRDQTYQPIAPGAMRSPL